MAIRYEESERMPFDFRMSEQTTSHAAVETEQRTKENHRKASRTYLRALQSAF